MHQITDWLAHSARDTRTHNGNRVWKSIRPPDCKMSVRCAAMAEFSTATAYRIECARCARAPGTLEYQIPIAAE